MAAPTATSSTSAVTALRIPEPDDPLDDPARECIGARQREPFEAVLRVVDRPRPELLLEADQHERLPALAHLVRAAIGGARLLDRAPVQELVRGHRARAL